MEKVRLADIARIAKVSEASVSRVFNGRPGVSQRMRQSVLTAAEAAGVPASGPRRDSGCLIGLLVPDLTSHPDVALIQSFEQQATKRGYALAICDQAMGVNGDRSIDHLTRSGVAGIVIMSNAHVSSFAPGITAELSALRVPFVLVDGQTPYENAPVVCTDERAGLQAAVRHLVELGHERIGLVVSQETDQPQRTDGFAAALAEFGLARADAAARWVHRTLAAPEGGRMAADALLGLDCTALLCETELMALGAVGRLEECGLLVPHDVSVVSLTDSPFAEFTRPPLTTLRKPVAAMARATLELLLEHTMGEFEQRLRFSFQPEIIERASTAARRRTQSEA
ncbi:LacI family DNA-binding transcriptional regulator [Streptomyces sp. NPDC059629]|uniref:LacI family DNA-binding transcriptional regulator n=1 Tax=Streptomyces sp. NPDC059629 TaxID=3346889 RepID=UPI0036AEDC4C